jgi:hypothetical protein
MRKGNKLIGVGAVYYLNNHGSLVLGTFFSSLLLMNVLNLVENPIACICERDVSLMFLDPTCSALKKSLSKLFAANSGVLKPVILFCFVTIQIRILYFCKKNG